MRDDLKVGYSAGQMNKAMVGSEPQRESPLQQQIANLGATGEALLRVYERLEARLDSITSVGVQTAEVYCQHDPVAKDASQTVQILGEINARFATLVNRLHTLAQCLDT